MMTQRLLRLKNKLVEVEKNLAPYRGIVGHGYPDLAYGREAPDSLAGELLKVREAGRIFGLPKVKRGESAKQKQQSKIGHYKGLYERHEKILSEISEVEAKLGSPLPTTLRDAATDADEFGHRMCVYGVLKGPDRTKKIVE